MTLTEKDLTGTECLHPTHELSHGFYMIVSSELKFLHSFLRINLDFRQDKYAFQQ
jgi:hypothetical protein